MSSFRFLFWSELRQGLSVFDEFKGKFIVLWGIPLFAVLLDIIKPTIGSQFKLPLSLFFIFAIAISFGAARVIYSIWCPCEIKDFQTRKEWNDHVEVERSRIVQRLILDRSLNDELEKYIVTHIDNSLRYIDGVDSFSDSQITILKSELTKSVRIMFSPVKENIDAIYNTTAKKYFELENSSVLARGFCSLCLALSVFIAGADLIDRALAVLHAAGF